jgi:hypothetical protein
MHKNVTGSISFVEPDARVLAMEGFLFPCCVADRTTGHSGFDFDLVSPEKLLIVGTGAERSYSLRPKDGNIASSLVGVMVVDYDYDYNGDDIQEIFCAYMVEGERTEDDPNLPVHCKFNFCCTSVLNKHSTKRTHALANLIVGQFASLFNRVSQETNLHASTFTNAYQVRGVHDT